MFTPDARADRGHLGAEQVPKHVEVMRAEVEQNAAAGFAPLLPRRERTRRDRKYRPRLANRRTARGKLTPQTRGRWMEAVVEPHRPGPSITACGFQHSEAPGQIR